MDNPAHPLVSHGVTPAPAMLTFRPEFFPLPARGRDPHFGFSRSAYYAFEREGHLRLVRVRRPGNIRGKVLVPYGDMVAMIRRFGKSSGKPHAPGTP